MSQTQESNELCSLNALDLAHQTNDATDNQLIKSPSLTSCSSNRSNEYEAEINRLRDLVRQKESDNAQLESRVTEIEHQSRLEVEKLNASLNQKLEESLKKIVAESQKDKNSMVMKYVEVERKCIEVTKSMQIQQSKMNDALKEKQRLMDKISKNKADYDKMCKDNEAKLKDLVEKKKEIERLKEKIVLNDAKESASVIKLKMEVDAHAQTKAWVEQLQVQIKKLEEKSSNLGDSETQTVTDIGDSFRSISPVNSEGEILKKELNLLKSQVKEMFEERAVLKEKVKQLHIDKNQVDNLLGHARDKAREHQNMNSNLLSENLHLKSQLELWQKEIGCKKELEHQVILYKSELNDLEQEMVLNKAKQSELLEFTARITEKNTQLQYENTLVNGKLEAIKQDLDKTKSDLGASNELIKNEAEKMRQELVTIQNQYSSMVKKFEEANKEAEDLRIKLGDVQDENLSLKKKHAANIKDLTRQLQAFQKKQNSTSSTPIPENQTTSQNCSSAQKISRTSSINSLNYPDEETRSIDSNFYNSSSLTPPSASFNNEVICGPTANTEDVYIVDVDKQKIIDKIVKLQKTLAKRNEKIDFLQEHVDQLTSDLKKKSKIIQAYAMTGDDIGAFTSEQHDTVKRELARKTSNLIGSDGHMNIELCLEINKKLQALLEDTLIKNLTLKENLETLGREIASLSKENRELKVRLT
ncbi:coiled-coil domain-containing protein [Brachionus plicatilis]|uniref:Coiled-coil domain-containing protein n=1 Tax=Brachionus plicatilis TaxID=10195 RepID=A0A3M7R6E4_BRAPC|nr:coiled-coil domain-containing protein [Brachionus plicatilis]